MVYRRRGINAVLFFACISFVCIYGAFKSLNEHTVWWKTEPLDPQDSDYAITAYDL